MEEELRQIKNKSKHEGFWRNLLLFTICGGKFTSYVITLCIDIIDILRECFPSHRE